MYNDIALGCHYSTDITSMFQHIKWRPFDFQEIDEAIRIDYVMGEHVLAYNKMSFTADYFCENIGLTKTFDFELNIMDINNIFMEKMLACSDKFNQQRFDKAEKHFFDLLNIFTNCVINPNTIMDFLEKKKGLDLKIIDNSRIYETFKFVVFKTDNEFLNKLLLQANELKCLQMLDFIRDIT